MLLSSVRNQYIKYSASQVRLPFPFLVKTHTASLVKSKALYITGNVTCTTRYFLVINSLAFGQQLPKDICTTKVSEKQKQSAFSHKEVKTETTKR